MNQLPATNSRHQPPGQLPRSTGSAPLGWKSVFGAGRLWFGLQSCLVCLLVLSAGGLRAQPPAGPLAQPANRYLLIVDISQAMEARERSTLKVVQELLNSGMNGQIKPGDTMGVWTYNANLYAGRFPLQRWSPGQQKAITMRLLTFLKGQKYEKPADLTNVLPALERVIKESHLITVILICAGDGAMSGTPVDDRINEFCRRWQDKQKGAKMPFVIVLRARNGEITDYTLNTPPWAVQMPSLPAETHFAAAPVSSQVSEPPRQDQPPATPPLIVSGKKSKPLQAPKPEEAAPSKASKKAGPPAPPATAAKVEVAKVETVTAKVEAPVLSSAATTNAAQGVPVDQPKPAAPATEPTKAEPGPTAPPKSAPEPPPVQTSPSVQPTAPPAALASKLETAKAPAGTPPEAALIQPPAPIPAPITKTDTAKAPEPKPAPDTPVQVAAAAPLPAPSKPAPEPKPKTEAAAPAVPTASLATATNATIAGPQAPPATPASGLHSPALVSPAPAPEVTAAPAKGGPAPEPVAVPAPKPGPSREVPVVLSTTVTNTVPAPAVTSSNSPAPRSFPDAPAQTAVAAPAESFLNQKTTWIAGVLLLGVAFAFGWLALRRARTRSHASLITRSLDRER